jgi:hypothetical protein
VRLIYGWCSTDLWLKCHWFFDGVLPIRASRATDFYFLCYSFSVGTSLRILLYLPGSFQTHSHRLVRNKHVEFREKPNSVVRESTAKNVMPCGLLLTPAAADIPDSMAYLELFH